MVHLISHVVRKYFLQILMDLSVDPGIDGANNSTFDVDGLLDQFAGGLRSDKTGSFTQAAAKLDVLLSTPEQWSACWASLIRSVAAFGKAVRQDSKLAIDVPSIVADAKTAASKFQGMRTVYQSESESHVGEESIVIAAQAAAVNVSVSAQAAAVSGEQVSVESAEPVQSQEAPEYPSQDTLKSINTFVDVEEDAGRSSGPAPAPGVEGEEGQPPPARLSCHAFDTYVLHCLALNIQCAIEAACIGEHKGLQLEKGDSLLEWSSIMYAPDDLQHSSPVIAHAGPDGKTHPEVPITSLLMFSGPVSVGRGCSKKALKVLDVEFDIEGAGAHTIGLYISGDKIADVVTSEYFVPAWLVPLVKPKSEDVVTLEPTTVPVKCEIPEWIHGKLHIESSDESDRSITVNIPALRPSCPLSPGCALLRDALPGEVAVKPKRGQVVQGVPEELVGGSAWKKQRIACGGTPQAKAKSKAAAKAKAKGGSLSMMSAGGVPVDHLLG
jgi:hypothetical protein